MRTGVPSHLVATMLDEAEIATGRFAHHPIERRIGQPVVRIPAADIGMHTSEPDLLDMVAFEGDPRLWIVRIGRVLHLLIPEDRTERRTLIIERQGVADHLDALRRIAIGEAQRPHALIDRHFQLIDRHSISIDGVPNTEEWHIDEPLLDRVVMAIGEIDHRGLLAAFAAVSWLTHDPVIRHHVSPRCAQLKIAPIGFVSHLYGFAQFGFAVRLRLHDPTFADQAHHQPDGEGAAAETEAVNLIAHVVVAANEGVEVFGVLPDADTERLAKRGDRLEVLGADAVVVIDDLLWILGIGRRLDVDRLIEPPDVGGPRIIATDRQVPRICPRMIPLCSRFDSVLFTPKMFRIASYGDYSRSPLVLNGLAELLPVPSEKRTMFLATDYPPTPLFRWGVWPLFIQPSMAISRLAFLATHCFPPDAMP